MACSFVMRDCSYRTRKPGSEILRCSGGQPILFIMDIMQESPSALNQVNNSLLYRLKSFYLDLQMRFCQKLERFQDRQVQSFLRRHVKQQYQNKIKSEVIFKEPEDKFISRLERFIFHVVQKMTQFVQSLLAPHCEGRELTVLHSLRKNMYEKILMEVVDKKLQSLQAQISQCLRQNVQLRIKQTDFERALKNYEPIQVTQQESYFLKGNSRKNVTSAAKPRIRSPVRESGDNKELKFNGEREQSRENGQKDRQKNILRKLHDLKEQQQQLVMKTDLGQRSLVIHPKEKTQKNQKKLNAFQEKKLLNKHHLQSKNQHQFQQVRGVLKEKPIIPQQSVLLNPCFKAEINQEELKATEQYIRRQKISLKSPKELRKSQNKWKQPSQGRRKMQMPDYIEKGPIFQSINNFIVS